MHHSLLSRFQGALLTAAFGHEMGAYGQSEQERCKTTASGQPMLPFASAHWAGWYPGLERNASARQTSAGGKAATHCVRALVHANGWSEREMAAIGMQLASGAVSGTVPKRLRTDKASSDTLMAAECAIATLPLALFFHDDAKQQRLLQVVNLWQCSGAEAGLLAVGYAIAQVLHERLEPLLLLPQTIVYLKQSTANPAPPLLELIDTLEQMQTLVQQGAGLQSAIAQLPSGVDHSGKWAIALAFYCFLSTPDDVPLALRRAARCADARLVCALTGALSGAHNGIAGLPLAWRYQLSAVSLPGWGTSGAEMSQLAAHLFGVWSGGSTLTARTVTSAIAAPGVMRPR